jgi:hypothetical protein
MNEGYFSESEMQSELKYLNRNASQIIPDVG